jgi:ATP-binding cassette subfamily B protein
MNIFSFLKPYRTAITIALSLMLVELAVELLQPYLISRVIDEGITVQNVSVVFTWGGVLVACAFLAFVSGIINSYYAAHVSQSFGFDVRESLYGKIQSFAYKHFNRFPTSSLITRLTNDVTQIQNTVFMGLRIMMRAPLLVIGALIMSFVVNLKLALILFAIVPVLVVFLYWAMRKVGTLFRAVQQQLDDVNGVMQQNLLGMRLIKAFLRSDFEVAKFTRSSEELMERTMSALRFTEMTMPVVLFLMNMGIVAVLWFGSIDIRAADATVGELVAVVNYAMRMTALLSMFTMIMMTLSRARASAMRITEVLNAETDPAESTVSQTNPERPAESGSVRFRSVSFHYPGTRAPVLRDISLEVKPGETVAVLGATGSGKSTLFQMIPRLYEPTEGTIEIDHIDIRDWNVGQLRRQIGYVPQESLLFTGTVRENIAWGKEDASMEEIIEAAQAAQIHDTIKRLPNQYETMLGQRGVNLSGGQKQRLCIARALVRRPRILLLDDSTSALDLRTEARLMQALKRYECTTFLITQKLSTALNADKIVLLENGRISAVGKHDELWNHSELYRRIYQSQFGMEDVRHVQGMD